MASDARNYPAPPRGPLPAADAQGPTNPDARRPAGGCRTRPTSPAIPASSPWEATCPAGAGSGLASTGPSSSPAKQGRPKYCSSTTLVPAATSTEPAKKPLPLAAESRHPSSIDGQLESNSACAVRRVKTNPRPENHVGDIRATPSRTRRADRPRARQPRRENHFAPTKIASGVRIYGFRFLHPQLGRWVSRDPLEEAVYAVEAEHVAASPIRRLCCSSQTSCPPSRRRRGRGTHSSRRTRFGDIRQRR